MPLPQPKTNEWVREVRSTVGGSLAPAVLGASRWMSPLDAWRTIVEARRGKVRTIDSDDMRRGRMLEPIALELLSEELGVPVAPHNQAHLITREDWPWAHALPDGWVSGWIVEAKAPRPGVCARIAADGPLTEYVIQCQHNLAVTKAIGCHLVVLHPLTMRILHFRIRRDSELIARIEREEREFWGYVERDEPPPAGEIQQPPTERLPKVESSVPEIDRSDVRDLVRDYLRLLDTERDIADAKKIIVEKLTALVPADVFDVPNVHVDAMGRRYESVRVYHRQTAPRRIFDHKSAIAIHPDLNEDRFWKLSKPSRPFKVYARS